VYVAPIHKANSVLRDRGELRGVVDEADFVAVHKAVQSERARHSIRAILNKQGAW